MSTTHRTAINATLNPRAAEVCAEHGLSLDQGRYEVVSAAPYTDRLLVLGYTDDVAKACDVAAALAPAALAPVVPGETFSARRF